MKTTNCRFHECQALRSHVAQHRFLRIELCRPVEANSAFICRRFFSNSSRIHLFTVACALMKKGASAVEQQFKRAWKYGDSTTLKAILHITINIMSAWRNFAASYVVTSP